jgi:hypothetical protein
MRCIHRVGDDADLALVGHAPSAAIHDSAIGRTTVMPGTRMAAIAVPNVVSGSGIQKYIAMNDPPNPRSCRLIEGTVSPYNAHVDRPRRATASQRSGRT